MVELVTDGLELERDGSLWIFTITGAPSRRLVDAWYEAVQAYIAQQEPSKKRYLVYDVTQYPNFVISPYLRERLKHAGEQDKGASGRLGIVLPLSLPFRSSIQFFVQRSARHTQPNLYIQMFHTRDETLAWVRAVMQP